jgi:hypothetical protein
MLNPRDRGGFSLLEILLSVAMTLVVGGAIHNLLVTTQRLTRVQGERISLQSNVRAGSLILREELGELSTVEGGTADQNDIIAAGSSAISYRAMRGIGFICQAPSATTVRIARNSYSGHRDPQAGRDEVYVFVPGNPAAETKDSWVPARILSVATTTACAMGQGAGITLTLSGSVTQGVLEPGTPVRITEQMELRLYRSDDRSWLGARSVSTGETIQPLLGPLSQTHGFQLAYLDGTGAPTLDRARIKSIRTTIRGASEAVGTGTSSPVEEELITQITLRNSSAP